MMVYCQKCKSQNSSENPNCQQCGADLLPPKSKANRITRLAIFSLVGIGIAAFGYATKEAFMLYFCSGIGGLFVISGIRAMVRKTPLHERYIERAQRHASLDFEQALHDFSSAIEFAPDKEMHKPIKEQAKLPGDHQAALLANISKASRLMQKGREKLVSKLPKKLQKLALVGVDQQKKLIKSNGNSPKERLHYSYLLEACIETVVPEKDYGTDPLQAITTGAGTGLKRGFLSNEVNSERKKLVEEGAIKILGLCPSCKDIVELNEKLKCINHGKKVKGKPAYVLPEEFNEVRGILRKRRIK